MLPPLRRPVAVPEPPKPAQPVRPDMTRRLPEPPARRPAIAPAMVAQPRTEPPEGKRLTVGRDISLSGEINACEVLVVEGRVEASLADSRLVEVSESGFFKGHCEIDNADIAGRYEGSLTVRDRLLVRSTGRVSGTIRYGRLEIELGGELVGDVQVLVLGAPAVTLPAPQPETVPENAAE